MAKLVILGSSNAIPDPEHENTHMALIANERTLLIDSGNNPVVRLPQAGINLDGLTDLILTHFHPDHVSGVPLLLMVMWLSGRSKPLNVFGLPYTLERLEGLMGFYNWEKWPNFFPVTFHPLEEKEKVLVLEDEEIRVLSSPVRHLIPTIALRFEFKQAAKVLAYSCDTEPCQEVVNLAGGADVLIHEAAGPSKGHSSGSQAGAIARQAEVGELFLIHYPTGGIDPRPLVEQAKEAFGGQVSLAEDFLELNF